MLGSRGFYRRRTGVQTGAGLPSRLHTREGDRMQRVGADPGEDSLALGVVDLTLQPSDERRGLVVDRLPAVQTCVWFGQNCLPRART